MYNHSDLVCNHCGELDNKANSDLILRVLNEFQLFVGHHRLVLNSVYRCKVHNRNLGSKDSSQHRLTLAIDLGCNSYTPEELHDKAVAFGKFQAIGIYSWGIHCDIRKIPLITWDKRSKERKELHKITSS